MTTLQIEYNGFVIGEEQIHQYIQMVRNAFEWVMEQVQKGIELLSEAINRLADAIKNDARRIGDAITEMLDNYDDAIKVEQSKTFYYGEISVKVTDSSFYLPKVNTSPIWTHRRYHMDRR